MVDETKAYQNKSAMHLLKNSEHLSEKFRQIYRY